jgi:Mg2+/Co2+ transporter CorB
MEINIEMRSPVLANRVGGLSGPAIKPLVLKLLSDVYKSVKIPIIGTGGICNGRDAIAIIMAGAKLIGVGTGIYYKGPEVFKLLTDEMNEWMDKEGVTDLDEIRGAIELKHKEGSMFKYDKDMLGGILDLGEVEISEIIIHRKNMESINIDQDVDDIIRQAFEIGHSNIPLWQNDRDNIVAILNMKKMFKILHHKKTNIKDLKLDDITSEPWFVPSTNSLRNQLFAFRKKKNKFAVVVDEYGALMGIITLEDILEEIVGEINDENRKDMAKITKIKNDFYKIPGEATIRDVNRKLNWELPEDNEVSTMAGLVVSKIERIPEVEEEFQFDDFIFKIMKKQHNQIVMLKVKKIKETLAQ